MHGQNNIKVKNVSLEQWLWNPYSVATQQSLRPAIHSGTQCKTSPQIKWPFFDQTPYLSCSLRHHNVLSKLNTWSVPFSMDPYTNNPQLYWNTVAVDVTACCCCQQRYAWHKVNRIFGIVLIFCQKSHNSIAVVVVVTPSSLRRLLVILYQDFLGNF